MTLPPHAAPDPEIAKRLAVAREQAAAARAALKEAKAAVRAGDDPAAIVRQLLAAVPSGSWLAIVQPTKDVLTAQMTKVIDRLNPRTTTPATLRTHDDTHALFRRHKPGGSWACAAASLAPGTRRGRLGRGHTRLWRVGAKALT